MVRAVVTTAATLAALAFTAAPQATLTPNVRGTVPMSGGKTTTPACFPDEPCDPPIGTVSTTVSFTRIGHAPVRIRAVGGSFALHLAPGVYAIDVTPAAGDVTPARVRVPRVGVVHLHLAVQPNP